MAQEERSVIVKELEWLKVHLRLAALEQSGPRLQYRFDFPPDLLSTLACNIYFTDDDANSIKMKSETGRREIYDGWIVVASNIIRNALQLANLPISLRWAPTVQYILYGSYGMGSSVVYTTEQVFVRPEAAP